MAVGDESIGFGGQVEIDDGASNAFVVLDKVVALGIPNETVGVVQSKRLDLAGGVIKKLATIKDGGQLTIRHQFTHAGFARVDAIRAAKSEKHFRFTIPDDDTSTVITVPGIITANKVPDLEAENITEIETTVEVSGAAS